uniref:Zinc finger protein RFP-like n=1 Tax=Chelonoidis abingdonii TaxID=106734 RepID=A0A8C0ITF0_CHEAB
MAATSLDDAGAMAAENHVESLQDEATCPVCLEYFTEPVTLECGHNFCRACIAQCWEGSDTAASCPQCRETVRQRNLRPNRQLANVLEIAKRLSLQAAKGAGEDGVCERHQEALKLFCEEDQTPICVVCDKSRAHRAHTVVPIEEAAQEYKITGWTPNTLSPPTKWLQTTGCIPWAPSMSLTRPFPIFIQKRTQTERQKIVSQFQQLRQFLKEQERLLLAQLENLDQEIERIQNENFSKLSEEISHLSELIGETEGKCQKPASEFLRVRLKEISPELEEQISGFSQKPIALVEALRKFKVNVTLDPDTAHPQLVLSKDRKSVKWADRRQRLPNNPERFDLEPCVLGCERFISGRHCWEVEVGSGEGWAVGVATESVGRKGQINRSPEAGIWALEWWGGQFRALTSPETLLPRRRIPSRIQVCLDCDRGQVTFIDAGDKAPIFTFSPASIPGERIRPWLCGEWRSRLRLCPSSCSTQGTQCFTALSDIIRLI